MSSAGIFMLIFATVVLLAGIYMYTGHKIGLLTGRVQFRNLTIEKWKEIGKYTMIVSIFIYIIGIVAIIFNFE